MLTLVSFKSKLFKPCKRLLHLFHYKRPLLVRSFRFRHLRKTKEKKNEGRKRRRLFGPWRRLGGGMDEVGELRSFAETVRDREPVPSPLTPAYIRMAAARRRDVEACDDVEEACQGFENYLVEMIVEEGKVRDLTDVEELLYYWDSLNSPVFIDLVCRFYGELCKDLFSSKKYELVDEAM